MNNAPVHSKILISKDGNIKTLLMPPNTTSLIQPIDQCIIASFNSIFKKQFLRKPLLVENTNTDSIINCISRYNMKDCIFNVLSSWNLVVKSVLKMLGASTDLV